MISCDRCKFRVRVFSAAVLCSAVDGQGIRVVQSPYTKVVTTTYGMRPSVDQMRRPGGQCGTDAKLFQMTKWRRWLGQKADSE